MIKKTIIITTMMITNIIIIIIDETPKNFLFKSEINQTNINKIFFVTKIIIIKQEQAE